MDSFTTVSEIGKANVLGVGVHAVNMHGAATILKTHISTNMKGYVCLTGVHGVMEVQRDSGLKIVCSPMLFLWLLMGCQPYGWDVCRAFTQWREYSART